MVRKPIDFLWGGSNYEMHPSYVDGLGWFTSFQLLVERLGHTPLEM